MGEGSGRVVGSARAAAARRSVDAWDGYRRIVVNFIHDTCTGTWFACVIVISTVSAQTHVLANGEAGVLASAERNVFWLMLASLAGLAVTGAARLLYWKRETPAELVVRKRKLLLLKHIAFVVIYGVGSVWAAATVF